MESIIAFAKLKLSIPGLTSVARYLNSKEWLPHFNKVYYEGSWTVLPLRSPGEKNDMITGDLMGQEEYAPTAYMQHFPEISTWLATLECPVMSVRLMNLKPGSVIKEHRDVELAFERGEARLHFPVLTNDKVEFYVKGKRVIMQQGDCWYINANLPHKVANLGATDRIHLVIDCKVNNWLKDVFNRAEKMMIHEDDSEQTRMMIKALRLQQNPASDKLADDLELKLVNSL